MQAIIQFPSFARGGMYVRMFFELAASWIIFPEENFISEDEIFVGFRGAGFFQSNRCSNLVDQLRAFKRVIVLVAPRKVIRGNSCSEDRNPSATWIRLLLNGVHNCSVEAPCRCAITRLRVDVGSLWLDGFSRSSKER